MKSFILYISLVLLSLSVYSCGDNVVNNPDVVFPDSLVSFRNHVQPFIKQTCALQGCHSSYYPQKNVVMSEWEQILFTYNGVMVIPFQPDASVLVQMLEYKLPHDPALYWNATGNQVKGIRKWIEEGAKNN